MLKHEGHSYPDRGFLGQQEYEMRILVATGMASLTIAGAMVLAYSI
jgi:hypothetical protein